MRNLIIALGLVASLVALTGCATKCNTCQESAVSHQDLKGEMVKK